MKRKVSLILFVAFISSHKGWGTKYVTNSLGPSMLLCDSLWIELSKNNHFGDAVMEAKKDFLNDAYDASLPYNWLLKSMNALGDCELPIYTNEPSVFSNVFLRVVYEAVYTHPENFTIAITSKEDNGDSFFYVYPPSSNTSITSEAFTRPCNVCLTKDNFIPFVTETGRFVSANKNYDLYLQNISYKSNEVCYEASNIIVGNQVDNTVETGDVVVEPGGKLDLYAFNRHIIQSGFRCKQGGQLKIGIYIEDEIE